MNPDAMFWLLSLTLLIGLFFVSGVKGFRAFASFGISIVILSVVVIPFILQNYDPALVVIGAALPITAFVIYLTEGFNTLSHLSITLTIVNFLAISAVSWFAINTAHFTGIISDEAAMVGGTLGVDLPHLLIASIMLSSLGALIEMIVTQVGTVTELVRANGHAGMDQIYRQAYTVGVIHLNSIINTLFLIYAGVLLPTVIVFSGSHNYLYGMLSYEPVSSEIMRMLVGTIGLIIAMPTTTRFAAYWLTKHPIATKSASIKRS